MQKQALLWVAPILLVALALGCGGSDKQPVSPSPSKSVAASDAAAGSDTVTLKVTAPTLTSPTGGVRLTTQQVTLTFQAATARFVSGETFSYRVQLLNAGSVVIEEKTGTATSYTMSTQFEQDTLYRWRVRAERQGMVGPWSTTETFKSMLKPSGYIRGNEIYDPLDDGKTVGTRVGSTTFIPGQGLRLDTTSSWVEYHVPTTSAAEFSVLASGIHTQGSTEDPKWRVISMCDGCGSFNDNPYLMRVEVRGNGVVAWRFITGDNRSGQYIQSRVGSVAFHESETYFFKATYGAGNFHVTIRQGGVNGGSVYEGGAPYGGNYTPPHQIVYLGSPANTARGEAASFKGMIVRQVWYSPNPRPSWAQ